MLIQMHPKRVLFPRIFNRIVCMVCIALEFKRTHLTYSNQQQNRQVQGKDSKYYLTNERR